MIHTSYYTTISRHLRIWKLFLIFESFVSSNYYLETDGGGNFIQSFCYVNKLASHFVQIFSKCCINIDRKQEVLPKNFFHVGYYSSSLQQYCPKCAFIGFRYRSTIVLYTHICSIIYMPQGYCLYNMINL